MCGGTQYSTFIHNHGRNTMLNKCLGNYSSSKMIENDLGFKPEQDGFYKKGPKLFLCIKEQDSIKVYMSPFVGDPREEFKKVANLPLFNIG